MAPYFGPPLPENRKHVSAPDEVFWRVGCRAGAVSQFWKPDAATVCLRWGPSGIGSGMRVPVGCAYVRPVPLFLDERRVGSSFAVLPSYRHS